MKKLGWFLLVLVTVGFSACNDSVTREADQLFKDGKYREAIQAYDEYLATKPKDVKSLYNRGRAYEELGQLSNAKTDFEKVLDLDGDNLNANLSMGKYWYNQKDFTKAIYYFDKVIEVDGRVSTAYLLKGRSLHQQGEFPEARENYDQAINFDNKNAEAFLYRGALKIAMNQSRSACNDFTRAKALGAEEANDALKKYCN
ncbi:tetratricopeptide repeat protein [Roseivirga sp.]|uniref:tetratricopeptide repeat protein n=1 Tax=Roseivirga sp. TaxID=1964215 RepID=UPI003B51C838